MPVRGAMKAWLRLPQTIQIGLFLLIAAVAARAFWQTGIVPGWIFLSAGLLFGMLMLSGAWFTLNLNTEVGLIVGAASDRRVQKFDTAGGMSDVFAARAVAPPEPPYWSILWSTLLGAAIAAAPTTMGAGWLAAAACWVLGLIAADRVRSGLAPTEREHRQSERDAAARRVDKALTAGRRVGPFILYLRPFRLTGAVRVFEPERLKAMAAGTTVTEGVEVGGDARMWVAPVWNVRAINVGEADEVLNPDVEALFEAALRPHGQLVALGRPGEAEGGGRILSTEADWQARVQRLSAAAAGVLAVPSGNAGTRWEMEWLKQSRSFRNCVFFMPGVQNGFDGAAYWREAREALKDVMELPRFLGPPGLFAFDGAGVAHFMPICRQAVGQGGSFSFIPDAALIKAAYGRLASIARGEPGGASEDLIGVAWKAASDHWGEGGLAKHVDNFPGREKATRIGDAPPAIGRCSNLVVLDAGAMWIEFPVEAPMDQVVLRICVTPAEGGVWARDCLAIALDVDLAAFERAHAKARAESSADGEVG